MGTIQARERLHGTNVVKWFVHVHGMQQRLVKAGLKHICYDQDAVRIFLKLLRNFRIRETVHGCRGQRRFLPFVFVIAGECHNRFIRTVTLREALVDGIMSSMLPSPAISARSRTFGSLRKIDSGGYDIEFARFRSFLGGDPIRSTFE